MEGNEDELKLLNSGERKAMRKEEMNIEDLACRLHSLKAEEEQLKKLMVAAMQMQKLSEVRTDAGLISFVEGRQMRVINKKRLEEILLRRFKLKPSRLKRAIADSHDSKSVEANVRIYSGEKYAECKTRRAA